MIIVGIDPGEKSGGIAVLQDDAVIATHRMPDISVFADLMEEAHRDKAHVFIEKAQAFPGGQGVVGMFNYGRHYGELLGVLAAFEIPHTLVRPRTWSAKLHAGTQGSDTKKRSLEAVRRLFPSLDIIPENCRTPHMGIVEAVLLAEYGRRTIGARE